MRRIILAFTLCISMASLLPMVVGALSVPNAPPLDRPVVDQTNTLTPAQIDDISAVIATSRSEKDYQIGILMVPTLGTDEYLEGYSLKVARQWGIGDKDKDNGVLLLIAKDDHKLRIEVGRGLEGDLTDIQSGRIIRNVITPHFKKNDFYGGIKDGVNSIQLAVAGIPDPKAEKASQSTSSPWETIQTFLFFIVFGIIWLGSMLARSKSWWGGGVVGFVAGLGTIITTHVHPLSVIGTIVLIVLGLLFDFVVSRNYHEHKADGTLPSWWAGGGSFGGGSSSGGSFGGGGFGGGGASGSW